LLQRVVENAGGAAAACEVPARHHRSAETAGDRVVTVPAIQPQAPADRADRRADAGDPREGEDRVRTGGTAADRPRRGRQHARVDQLIAVGGGKAGEEEARAMLGTIARDHVVRLAELLGAMNVPELLSCARSLEEFSPDYAQVLDELSSLFVRVAMKQAVSDFEGDELYDPEVLTRLASAIAP